ncbi:MAG: hypothetical protein WC934_06090 [Acidithiobacillus sp.]|jgi:hypothetical protein|uniref:hypothetical protein n=1 Tax=Acidithiobacillus sp. TaxID=1872118 RepID=UPI003560C397
MIKKIVKKIKLIACSSGDSSVGIRPFCTKFEAEINSNKVKVTPLTKEYESFEEILNDNLTQLPDNIIEKKLLPIFKELDDFDSLMTEASEQKWKKYKQQQDEEQYMRDLNDMSYKERDHHFKTQYKPKEREQIQQQFQIFKKKLIK